MWLDVWLASGSAGWLATLAGWLAPESREPTQERGKQESPVAVSNQTDCYRTPGSKQIIPDCKTTMTTRPTSCKMDLQD